ncbi:ABC transporter permease [Streptomyces avicenniae]|uniref:ABC transporter permease n=1 Tax=Streptomyces avicenniae TaxID=500153 RepID=UPI00167CE710|nr:FtsX-like permease family protein [Streptomyces avicenniae]
MLRYALATLRARKSGFAGAFLALFCAAALVTACGSLLETGLRGDIRTERYAAAPVVVTADQNVHHTTQKGDKTKHKAKPVYERVWLPADTADRIAAVPGAASVVPELTFPAEPLDAAGQPWDGPEAQGHAWSSASLTPFTIGEGRAPETDAEIVLDRGLADRAGLAVGDEVTVQSTDAPATYTVAGVAEGDVTEQAAVFFTDTEARRLAGHPGQDAMIGVVPAPGTSTAELADRIEDALDGTIARVHTGGDRGPAEFPDAAQARIQLVSMGGAIGGTGLLVAVLVVVGTFGLTARARHRELALLRAIAATPRQTRRLIGREALLVGVVAGPLGAIAGLPLAGWIFDRFIGLGTVPETLGQVRSPFPMAAAVLTTLLAAWLAARVSARRTARIRPAEALTEAAVEPRRTPVARLIAGFLTLAGGLVLLYVLSLLHVEPASTPVTYLTVLLLSVAVALLGPVLARVAFTVIGAPLRLSAVPGHLAAHNARAGARRLAAVITPLTLLVAMACTIVFTQTTLGDAAERQARDGVLADRVIAAAGPGVPHAAAEALRGTEGVTTVTEIVHSTVRTPGLDKYSVQGVTAGPGLDSTLDLDMTEGSLDGLADDGVAVSTVIADSKDLHPGDTLDLVLGDGTPVTTTVTGVYDRELGFGELTLSHDLLAAHIDNPLADALLLDTDLPDDRLGAALADFPGLAVRDGGHIADVMAQQRETSAEVAFLGMGLVLAFTTIAAVNTLAMATADRRREFGLLRKVGTTRRQVLRMLNLEALTVAVTAVLLGTAISFAVLTSFSAGMIGEAAPAMALTPYLLIVGTVTALTLVSTGIPARLSLPRRGPA